MALSKRILTGLLAAGAALPLGGCYGYGSDYGYDRPYSRGQTYGQPSLEDRGGYGDDDRYGQDQPIGREDNYQRSDGYGRNDYGRPAENDGYRGEEEYGQDGRDRYDGEDRGAVGGGNFDRGGRGYVGGRSDERRFGDYVYVGRVYGAHDGYGGGYGGMERLDPWLERTEQGREIARMGYGGEDYGRGGYGARNNPEGTNMWFRRYADTDRDMRLTDQEIDRALDAASRGRSRRY